jgi:hypothetical protein
VNISAIACRHQARRDHRADAEEGAVAERGQHPRGEQGVVARRDGGEGVAGDEQAEQEDQRALARHRGGEHRQDRRAHRHAQRVAADQQAGGGNAHLQVRRHFRQQAHDDELGGADAEGGQRQREQGKGEFHRGSPTRLSAWPPRPSA